MTGMDGGEWERLQSAIAEPGANTGVVLPMPGRVTPGFVELDDNVQVDPFEVVAMVANGELTQVYLRGAGGGWCLKVRRPLHEIAALLEQARGYPSPRPG